MTLEHHLAKTPSAYKEKKPWTKTEDAILKAAVHKVGEGRWSVVSMMVPGRNPTQCSQHWHKVLDPSLTKGFWTPAEDALLVKLKNASSKVARWKELAQSMPTRSAKQCRERWTNSLDPDLKRGRFSSIEDQIVVDSWKQHGPCWNLIAQHLPGRNQTKVRDRFKTIWTHKRAELEEWAATHKNQWKTAAEKRREMCAVRSQRKKESPTVEKTKRVARPAHEPNSVPKFVPPPSFVPPEMLMHFEAHGLLKTQPGLEVLPPGLEEKGESEKKLPPATVHHNAIPDVSSMEAASVTGNIEADVCSLGRPQVQVDISSELFGSMRAAKRRKPNMKMEATDNKEATRKSIRCGAKAPIKYSPEIGPASKWTNNLPPFALNTKNKSPEFPSSPESLILEEADALDELPDIMWL